jgi:hypothetical protein
VAAAGVPWQPLAAGVTVNVTVTGVLVVLVKSPVILPDPFAPMPVTATVLSLVQLNVVPLTAALKAIWVIVAPEQIVCDNGVATAAPGVGFTTTVVVIGMPEQPFAVGVIVNVTVTGALEVFINAPLKLPDPLAAIPVTEAVLFLVQLKVVPLMLLVNVTGVIVAPEQMVCVNGVAVATGAGFTSTVARLVQVPELGVMVNVTYSGAVLLFVSAPLILPDPLAPIPVTVVVLFLVQV